MIFTELITKDISRYFNSILFGVQMAQSFLNCSGILIAEMDATRSVDNDSGVGHKKRASQCDFIYFYMKHFRFSRFVKKSALFTMKKKY